MEFNFIRIVWQLLVVDFEIQIEIPKYWQGMFLSWHKSYPKYFKNNLLINRVWKLLQYYASYKIWLSRNSEIFENISSTPCKSATKYCGLLCEQFFPMDWETKVHLNRIQRKGIGLGSCYNPHLLSFKKSSRRQVKENGRSSSLNTKYILG